MYQPYWSLKMNINIKLYDVHAQYYANEVCKTSESLASFIIRLTCDSQLASFIAGFNAGELRMSVKERSQVK